MKTFGIVLIIIGLIILLAIFGPVLKEEFTYWTDRASGVRYSLKVDFNFPDSKFKQIIPESEFFGIVIPKIDANAKVYADVDPFNPEEFLPILKKGVAHAKGTGFPGEGKNIYLFAHKIHKIGLFFRDLRQHKYNIGCKFSYILYSLN